MKTDAQLKRDVSAELAWDPAINANAIGVGVKDGVVTRTGTSTPSSRRSPSSARCTASPARRRSRPGAPRRRRT
ncbi:MAG: BON domain-containing protein [Methylibium sp.]|nr:BON domain-containing protein [Methylibium sp.]